jgi:hypothetical protein
MERFCARVVDEGRGQSWELRMSSREHERRTAKIVALTMGGLFVVIYALNAITF